MSEAISLAPAPGEPQPVVVSSDERLSRIEAALSMLAARQAAGPPPSGYASGPAVGLNGATISMAVQAAQMAGYLPGAEKKKWNWKDWPVFRELRLVTGLYFDRRYTPSRAAQLGVPGLLILLVLNYFFWNVAFSVVVLSPILEYLVVMILAVLLYRILAGELKRYAAVLDYLERTGG